MVAEHVAEGERVLTLGPLCSGNEQAQQDGLRSWQG